MLWGPLYINLAHNFHAINIVLAFHTDFKAQKRITVQKKKLMIHYLNDQLYQAEFHHEDEI